MTIRKKAENDNVKADADEFFTTITAYTREIYTTH